jgi:hypothetical protein
MQRRVGHPTPQRSADLPPDAGSSSSSGKRKRGGGQASVGGLVCRGALAATALVATIVVVRTALAGGVGRLMLFVSRGAPMGGTPYLLRSICYRRVRGGDARAAVDRSWRMAIGHLPNLAQIGSCAHCRRWCGCQPATAAPDALVAHADVISRANELIHLDAPARCSRYTL